MISAQLRSVDSMRWGVPCLLALFVVVTILSVPPASCAESQTAPDRAVVKVVGMACPFCAYGIRKHLRSLPGVKNVEVDLAESKAIIEVNGHAKPTDAEIQQAIKDAGFTPGSIQWQASAGDALTKSAEFSVTDRKSVV